jgi:hypothetical protein
MWSTLTMSTFGSTSNREPSPRAQGSSLIEKYGALVAPSAPANRAATYFALHRH